MKKISLICLALVLAMGTLGVGYASWTDTVYIDGTVDTGEVCVWFGPSAGVDDPYAPPPYIPPEPPPDMRDWNTTEGENFPDRVYRVDKNVGWGDAVVSVDRKTMTVTFSNVYPCYYNHVGFWIYNCGTVPVKIQKFIFKDGDGNEIAVIDKTSPDEAKYITLDLSGDGEVDDLELQWGNDPGTQLEEGEGVNHSFSIHMLQDETIDFSEPQSFTFSIEIVAIQWNAY
jgi:hypothetical protein